MSFFSSFFSGSQQQDKIESDNKEPSEFLSLDVANWAQQLQHFRHQLHDERKAIAEMRENNIINFTIMCMLMQQMESSNKMVENDDDG